MSGRPKITLGIISPAGPVPPEVFDAGVAALEKLSITVKVFPHARGKSGYLSGSTDERLKDFNSAWFGPVHGILCARGGFGSAYLLPLLDWQKMKSRSLPLLGFSDITALHLAMDKMGVGRPIAAPMLKFIPDLDHESLMSFLRAFGRRDSEFGHMEDLTLKAEFSGRPLAGNLTMMASLVGTPYFPDPTGRVLVLEEVGEPLYRIDRMLTQLEQSGVLTACAGVVFGYFTEGEFTGDELRELLFGVVKRACKPVVLGFPFGHKLPFHAIDFSARWEVKDGKIAQLFE